MSFVHVVLINIGALIAALGGVFLKQLSLNLNQNSANFILQILLSKEAWLGGLCYVIPIGFWTYILRTVELTKLQPMLSIVYIYTVGLAFFFLDEKPSVMRLVGIAIVIIGVIIVGKS
ncbi:EamA family transporter [Comamonas sediminis]|uniref:EamA family transporter n=1 Tax=Comamonas sediminis TaxID=1783360 RepID=UPI003D2B85CD